MRFYKRTALAVLAAAILTAAGVAFNSAAEQKPETPPADTAPETPETAIVAIQQIPASLPTQTPEPEPERPRIYSSIPLDTELQEFTYWRCKELSIDYEMVLAIMQKESNFDEKAISATDDYGIMQINDCNHARLREELGITDFLDARQSITAGTEILAELAAKYSDTNQVLMAYNMGESGARKLWKKGTTTSKYSRDIMARRAAIIREEENNGD